MGMSSSYNSIIEDDIKLVIKKLWSGFFEQHKTQEANEYFINGVDNINR